LDGKIRAIEGTFTVSARFIGVGEVEPWTELEMFLRRCKITWYCSVKTLAET
jgi:hypothetical protein